MHRHRKKGLKREHSIIDGAEELLQQLTRCPYVKSVIPGRIYNARVYVMQVHLTFQYYERTGLKLLARTSTGVQEIFVVSNEPSKVREWLEEHGLILRGGKSTAGEKKRNKADRQSPSRKRKKEAQQTSRMPASREFIDEYLREQARRDDFGVRLDRSSRLALQSLKSELLGKEEQKRAQTQADPGRGGNGKFGGHGRHEVEIEDSNN